MRRFFIQVPLQDKITISGDDAHHIIHVLRYKIGQNFIVVDVNGKIAETEIIEIENDILTLQIVSILEENTEAPIEVTLAQCLPKSDKMDFIVQKAVELGVSRIIPVISQNCVVKYDDAKKEARRKKWQKIAIEAAKQCGRTILPTVSPIMQLKQLQLELQQDTIAFMCYEGQADAAIKSLLTTTEAKKFLILIGPEGGFTQNEVTDCKEFGVRVVTMGPRILRTETASLAAISMVMYQNGDLGGECFGKSCSHNAGV
ncbi:16S rRNA (uracil(1498)-N(3))-methyltransferase [Anaerosinus massiliensis]|uniref:16S rRNA (uracil(1498)-N(3))-methyltransferase n=1 Tax=Massilibacillus massiliensis TaxID=1806837 RepID=UPI000B0E8047|nr:16S rRNA (uracil(1498)-N(3))-methyltransferase [Massilibacillus massiliensis]